MKTYFILPFFLLILFGTVQANTNDVQATSNNYSQQERAMNTQASMEHERSVEGNTHTKASQSNHREVNFALSFKGKGNADADSDMYQQRQFEAQQAYALQLQQMRQFQLMNQMLTNYYYYPQYAYPFGNYVPAAPASSY